MRFEIDALEPNGNVASLTVDAPNAVDAQAQVVARGYTVLKSRRRAGLPELISLRPTFPLLLVTQELITLLDAGLTLIEALRTLARKEHRGEVKRVLDALLEGLSEGLPFSQALERFPGS